MLSLECWKWGVRDKTRWCGAVSGTCWFVSRTCGMCKDTAAASGAGLWQCTVVQSHSWLLADCRGLGGDPDGTDFGCVRTGPVCFKWPRGSSQLCAVLLHCICVFWTLDYGLFKLTVSSASWVAVEVCFHFCDAGCKILLSGWRNAGDKA